MPETQALANQTPDVVSYRGGRHGTGSPSGRLFLAALFLFLAFSLDTPAVDFPAFPAPTHEQARAWYTFARSNYFNTPSNTTSAWKFAEACFEWAEYATNHTERAELAAEGIAAAEYTVEHGPQLAAGHFYLAMNQGQLARTRTLGALPLVKEMELHFLRAIALDPKFDHAAPHRSLGMLYLEAPGWPVSLGSKAKARQHLERAVALVPDYPTNHLTLMDAYLRWRDTSALRTALTRYRLLLPAARTQYTGDKWQNSWRIWDAEWKTILEKEAEMDR